MKLFAKLMIFVLVAAMAGPFIIRGPDGRPLMQLSDVTQRFKGWMNSSGSSSPSPGGNVEVHKWQDENGQWHYSDAAPAAKSETISINPNTNVIQSTPVRKPAPAEGTAAPEQPAEQDDDMPSIFHPVDETKKVREELEQRNEEMKKRMEDN